MENLFTIKSLHTFYAEYQLLIMLSIMVTFLYPFLISIKKVVLPGISKLIGYKNKKYAEILYKKNLPGHITKVFLALYLEFWSDLLDQSNLINNVIIKIKDVVITTYVIFAITSLILAIINATADLYNVRELNRKIAIELHTQILRIFVVVSAILAIFSLVIGISISSLFTSLGAAAALLTFVFKDTLLGLIASLQVTFQNIIQVGDWVTLPQYNADGDIQKITITVVVIRNFDNTYTTVPTSAFLTTGVKNWRPMFEMGGRRIKRAISLDMSTVKICTQKELNAIKKLPYMLEFAAENKTLFNQENQTTNLTTFRHYIGQYLKNNKNIHQEGFTFLIRTLDPTPNGIPIEIYVFTKDTKWLNYEEVQASIFEHLLGILPIFKLKAFQAISSSQ
jgi:miniconductance mechanosensitive channel